MSLATLYYTAAGNTLKLCEKQCGITRCSILVHLRRYLGVYLWNADLGIQSENCVGRNGAGVAGGVSPSAIMTSWWRRLKSSGSDFEPQSSPDRFLSNSALEEESATTFPCLPSQLYFPSLQLPISILRILPSQLPRRPFVSVPLLTALARYFSLSPFNYFSPLTSSLFSSITSYLHRSLALLPACSRSCESIRIASGPTTTHLLTSIFQA